MLLCCQRTGPTHKPTTGALSKSSCSKRAIFGCVACMHPACTPAYRHYSVALGASRHEVYVRTSVRYVRVFSARVGGTRSKAKSLRLMHSGIHRGNPSATSDTEDSLSNITGTTPTGLYKRTHAFRGTGSVHIRGSRLGWADLSIKRCPYELLLKIVRLADLPS